MSRSPLKGIQFGIPPDHLRPDITILKRRAGEMAGQQSEWFLSAPETGVRIQACRGANRIWQGPCWSTATVRQAASSELTKTDLASKVISHSESVYALLIVRLYHPNEPRSFTRASLLLCGLVRFFFIYGPKKMPRSPPYDT